MMELQQALCAAAARIFSVLPHGEAGKSAIRELGNFFALAKFTRQTALAVAVCTALWDAIFPLNVPLRIVVS
jgi:hypothetical protein